MFDPQQKSTGTQYTLTVTLLLAAFVISPVVLFISAPIGYVTASLAAICSTLCIACAWVSWRRYSALTIPSIEAPHRTAK